MIAGLEKPDSGSVTIGGKDVSGWTAAERDVALVLQQYSLYPRLTVRGNLEFPLRAPGRKFSDAEIAARVDKAATTLQITHLLDRKVERLSGGEMQRVSIGRAIVRQPSVFLMDEPLSALDAKLRETLRVELKKLHSNLGATFLFVTHDQVEAMSMGDKIGVLRQGRLVQVGTPSDIYERPLNTFVARSVGSPPMNLINGQLAGGMADLGGFQLPVAANAKGSGAVTFGVRPENVVLAAGAPGEARVFDIEDQGVVKILVMDMGEARLHVDGARRNPRPARRTCPLRLEARPGGDLRRRDRRKPGAGLTGAAAESGAGQDCPAPVFPACGSVRLETCSDRGARVRG